MPFGQGIHDAFQYIKEIALDMGFSVNDEDGYAIDIRTGNSDEYIGILCHIDTVEAIEMDKWRTDPYVLTEIENVLYGRGVNDNKGPLLLSLYALHILNSQQKLTKDIRLIIGGAEETTWECMDYYFSRNPQPLWAYSPDGDFPIVNGEKGTLQVEITFEDENYESEENEIKLTTNKEFGFIANKGQIEFLSGERVYLEGKHAVSRHPERGVSVEVDLLKLVEERKLLEHLSDTHAFSKLIYFIKEQVQDKEKDAFNIQKDDPEMGDSSVAITYLTYENGCSAIELDFRYTRNHTEETLFKTIERTAVTYGGKVKKKSGRELLFVDKDSELIEILKEAYESATGNQAELITKGGASYARVLDRGIAFGPTFPGEIPNSHLENEKMSIESLKKALEIYLVVLENLAK